MKEIIDIYKLTMGKSQYFKEKAIQVLMNGREELDKYIRKEFQNEMFVKWILAKEFSKKEGIGIFELPINNNRADFVFIYEDGTTHGFEIKTEYDNFTRLENQIEEYLNIFDYTTVVIYKKYYKALMYIFERYPIGIINYESGKVNEVKSSPKTENNRRSLLDALYITDYVKAKICKMNMKNREEKLEELNKSNFDVGKFYVENITKKYQKKWEFVKENIDGIKTFEIQEAFSCPESYEYEMLNRKEWKNV